jgi:hypothetical protein
MNPYTVNSFLFVVYQFSWFSKMTHRNIYFRFTRHALQLHHVTMLNYLHGYKRLCCQSLAYRQTEIKWSFFVEHLNSWFTGTHVKFYCIYQYFMSINSFFNTVSVSRYSRPINSDPWPTLARSTSLFLICCYNYSDTRLIVKFFTQHKSTFVLSKPCLPPNGNQMVIFRRTFKFVVYWYPRKPRKLVYHE